MEEEHQPQSDHEVSKELEEEVSKETVEEEVVDIGQLETEEPIKKVDGETEVVDTPVPDLGRGLHEKKHPTQLQDYILSTVQKYEDLSGGEFELEFDSLYGIDQFCLVIVSQPRILLS